MEKIFTRGCSALREFFKEIGIGIGGSNLHLVGEGYSGGYLLGNTDAYYYVDKNGLFQSVSRLHLPKDYEESGVEYFIKYHRKRLKISTITVTKKELGKIYEVACITWKTKIQDLTLRNPFGDDVELTQKEIDEMFKAATKEQIPTLESIFGEQKKEIDFDRIKTGSQVMIEYTGAQCGGFSEIDQSRPVSVVFFKTSHLIDADGHFQSKGSHSLYCTFNQGTNFVLFSADGDQLDYITEVIEY